MPPSSPKSPLSPSELSQLEHAFATDPASDAYGPLAEAYLSMGRFMEAMVVCKKGVKAHPDAASARVLLARVYADQGKDKKALEELQGALQVAPNDASALRMTGGLLCKAGDVAGGGEHLKKALLASPQDEEALALCQKYGVQPPTAAPVAPPAPAIPVAAAPALQAPAPAAIPVYAPAQAPAPAHAPAYAAAPGASVQPSYPAPVQLPVQMPEQPAVVPAAAAAVANALASADAPVLQAPAHAHRPSNGTHAATAGGPPVLSRSASAAPAPAPRPRPRPQPRPQPRTELVSYEELQAKFGDADEAPQKKGGSNGVLISLVLVLVGALGLGGFWYHSKTTAEKRAKIERLLKTMQEELSHDSFASYKKACEAGDKIVGDLDPDLFSAHAYLAYANAIRWGEHGEGELAEKAAKEHLARAKEAKTEHSHLIAAESYIRFFGGDAQGAVDALAKMVEEDERYRKSPLLLSTLGILEINAGDLDSAFKYLKAAQGIAPADPRISAALGNVLRRQGQEFLAANSYETALRYERDHAEAQLGVALMALDGGKLETAEKYVNRMLPREGVESTISNRQLALAQLAHALILDEQGKKLEAEQEEQRAFANDSRNGELFILKSRRLMRAGRADDAVTAIREAIKLEPKRASFYVDLAKALVSKPGGAKEAIDSMQQALKSMPGSPKLLVLLGDAYRADNQLDQARTQYEKALAEAKDKLPEARMALADLARQRKDFPKALELYERAKNEFLSSPERQAYALTEMGRIHEESDKKKAFDAYKAAAMADGTYAPPLFHIGRMLMSDRDKTKRSNGAQFLEQYVRLAPKGEFLAEAQRLMSEK